MKKPTILYFKFLFKKNEINKQIQKRPQKKKKKKKKKKKLYIWL